MTLVGRIVALFPLIYLCGILFLFSNFVLQRDLLFLALMIAWVYLLPLLLFRLHQLICPVSEGFFDLTKKQYNAWWGSHQFQFPFIACPWLEGLLHFVPGLFSLWLRMWGSPIGKNVYWTPRVEILDRNLIEVGDSVVFGHLAAMSSHMVANIEGRPHLVLKKVKFGQRSFVGADSQFGPGALIEEKEKVKPKTRRTWRGEWL